ncbi:MAG: hypothetical protein DRG78_21935 [Epsilonproteobacteria bacterium]|nr:MAG: hypothetical protein DRG78_21935 [Campylobacterota bacterium]
MGLWNGVGDISEGESVKSTRTNYEIIKVLNRGKMAMAYHARDSSGKSIFLKHTTNPMNMNKGYANYIRGQHLILDVLNNIGEQFVEKNYEYFEFEGRHFQAKEFLAGVDLKAVIWPKDQSEKLNFNSRLNAITVLAGLVKIIHSHGLIHSDLKPEQIFVTKDDSLKFGFKMKLIDFDHSIVPNQNVYIPAGTPGWYSPEHFRENEKVVYASDIFTLGNMFYTILTNGQKPFSDFSSESDAKYKGAIKKAKSLKPLDVLFGDKFPKSISDLVSSMLHPNQKKRPQASEVHKVLLDFKNGMSKPKYIKLYFDGNSRTIVKNEVFTREMAKNLSSNYKSIYTRQFEIIKDSSGNWFIKGLPIPKTAKSRSGEVFYFYPTKVDGQNITNKIVKLFDDMKIGIGNAILNIKTKT